MPFAYSSVIRCGNDSFLKRMITGEKWIVYDNVTHKDHGGTAMSRRKQSRRRDCIQRRSCFPYGGILRVSSTMSCYRRAKRLIQPYIAYS